MLKLIFYSLLIGSLTGCAIYQTPSTITTSNNRYIISNEVLIGRIQIINTRIETNNAKVEIKNKKAIAQHLRLRFYWYGENGLEVFPFVSEWRNMTIGPKEKLSIKQLIPNTSISEFRVEISQ